MKLKLICVGAKPPHWIQTGIDEYQKRLPKHWHFEQVLLAGADRKRPASKEEYQLAEAKAIQAAKTQGAISIALDERGKALSTSQLTKQLEDWQMQNIDVDWIIGGADGLAPSIKQGAHDIWSLSALTLPHALARLLFVEQLYRAASLLAGHPYHRD